MAVESSYWAQLTQSQGQFFKEQVGAAISMGFSPAAHEAEVVPLNGIRYSVEIGKRLLGALAWPDPYEAQSMCVVMGMVNQGGKAFTRVKELDQGQGYQVEGAALDVNYTHNVYGRQQFSAQRNSGHRAPYLAAGDFYSAALDYADSLPKTFAPPTSLQQEGSSLVGMESTVSARLFRSLSSLGSNLIVGGATGEVGVFSSTTYDLAQSLLKTSIRGVAATAQQSPYEMILHGTNGNAAGAVFESEQFGLVVVTRPPGAPQKIAVAIASRPLPDEISDMAELYCIGAAHTLMDAALVSPDHPPAQFLLERSLALAANAYADADVLDSEGAQRLEQRLAGFLLEMTQRTTA